MGQGDWLGAGVHEAEDCWVSVAHVHIHMPLCMQVHAPQVGLGASHTNMHMCMHLRHVSLPTYMHICVDMSTPSHTCTRLCIFTLCTRVHPICVNSPHGYSHLDTYTCRCVHHSSCVDGAGPPTLLNKRAYFLSLTSKLSVIHKINEAEVGILSLFLMFIQPIFPEYPLCAGPYVQCCGGRHKFGLSPAPQEHQMQGGRGP